MPSAMTRLGDWLNAPAPPQRLASMRIIIGAFVVVYLIVNISEVGRLNHIDPADFAPVGLAHLLSGPVAPGVLWAAYLGAIVTGVAFVVGWHYAIAAPVFAGLVLFWASYHSSFGQLLHFEHLFTLHVLLLSVAPAAAVWAVSSDRSKTSREAPASSVRYGWPIRLLGITTVVTYVLSGLAKWYLSGWGWVDGSVLGDHIAYSAIRTELVGGATPPLGDWVLAHSWLLAPMAIGAFILEVGAPVALVGGRVRDLWVLSALVFHAATGLIMWVYFGYRGLGFAMVPFYAAEVVMAPALAWLSHLRRRPTMLRTR